MQEVQEKLIDSGVDQQLAMFAMIESLFSSKGTIAKQTIKLFTCLEDLPIDWQVYIPENVSFTRQKNVFPFWRNVVFFFLYELPSLKDEYNGLFPYPKQIQEDETAL